MPNQTQNLGGFSISLSWPILGFAALVLLGLGLIGGWSLRAALSGENTEGPVGGGFRRDSSALRPGDLLRGTRPTGGIVYEVDTTASDTFGVVLPQFVRDTLFTDSPPRNVSYQSPDITLGDITQRRYLNFLALPLVDGSPTLKVTPDVVTGNFYDPQDGRGITMKWNVPSYANKIGVSGGASVTISDATILSTNPTIFWKRNNYRLDLGYRLSNRPIFQGVTVSLRFEKVLSKF